MCFALPKFVIKQINNERGIYMKRKFICITAAFVMAIASVTNVSAWTACYGVRTYDSAYDYDSVKYQTTEYVTSDGINYLPYSLLKSKPINGANISYNANTQSITIENGEWISSGRAFKAVFKAGSTKVSINRMLSGVYLWENISYAPKYINGELCIPVQSLTEIFNGRTSQDINAGTVSILIPLA